MSTQKKSFIMYLNYRNQFDRLSMEQKGRLISAIFEYCEEGEISTPLDAVCDMAFSMIKDTLDRDAEKYENICKRSRENGKKGGRPKKPTGFFENLKEPEKADNDNVNDNENENENGIDSDSDSGSGSDNENDNENKQAAAAAYTTPTTPPPREINKEDLVSEGIPERYIDEVYKRAEYYSSLCGVGIYEQIREWWQSDRSNPKWSAAKDERSRVYNAEVEEWFQKRLEQFYGDC